MKKTIIYLIGLILIIAQAAYADPFAMQPGIKAKGMAGAFTAIADDESAIYYNPAGLADVERNNPNSISTNLEIGSGISVNMQAGRCNGTYNNGYPGCSWSYFQTNEAQYFLGATYSFDNFTAGFAFYNLYNIVYPLVFTLTQNGTNYLSSTAYVGQDMKVLQLGLAYKLFNILDVGAALGFSISNFASFTSPYSINDFTVGFFGTFGAKGNFEIAKPLKVMAGVSYRTPGQMLLPVRDIYYGATTSLPPQEVNIDQASLWEMPGELAGGVGLKVSTSIINLTLAGDYRLTYYNKHFHDTGTSSNQTGNNQYFYFSNTATSSVGAQIEGVDFRVYLRGGYRYSYDDLKMFQSDGFSLGLGYDFGGKGEGFFQRIEVSYEYNNYYLLIDTSSRAQGKSSNIYAASIYWML